MVGCTMRACWAAGASVTMSPISRTPWLARHAAPNDVATADAGRRALRNRALDMRIDEVADRVATHIDEALAEEQSFDFFPRPAADKWKLVADADIFRAGAGT